VSSDARSALRDAPRVGVSGAGTLPRWRVFPALALGTLMATLDISIVNIALPTLSRAFRSPLTSIEWVVLSYVVVLTGLQLAFGHLADRVGRRRVYLTGLALFVTASTLCAAAPTAGMLIAARALQGLGTAMMMANTAALLVSSFPPEERGRALGLFGAAVGAGLALGPPLGGLIVGHASWRWIFLINLPLGVLCGALARRRLPADAPTHTSPLPVANAITWCAGLVLGLVALSRGPADGWTAPAVIACATLAPVCLGVFAWLESRAADPLLSIGLLRGPLGTAVLLTFLVQTVFISVALQMPLFLEDVIGFDAAEAGRWLMVLPLSAFLLAPIAGRWVDMVGPRPLALSGLTLGAAGCVAISSLSARPGPWQLFLSLALFGVGMGLFSIPNSSALLGAVRPDQLGLASGLQATMRNLGISGGTALTGAVLAMRVSAHGGGALSAGNTSETARAALVLASRELYLGLAGITLVALLVAAAGTPGKEPRGAPARAA